MGFEIARVSDAVRTVEGNTTRVCRFYWSGML